MRSSVKVRGAYPAPSVPFNEDFSINEGEFADHLGRIAAADGVSGVVVNGHAGEVTALTGAERVRVVELARSAVPAGKLVVSGVDDFSVGGTIEKLKAVQDAGADAALVLPPFDYLPRRNLTQTSDAPFWYFSAVAEKCDLPLIVFEYPKSTGISYSTDTLLRLSEIDTIVGIKDTVTDDQAYQEHVEVVRPRIPLLTAVDSPELLGLMLLGSDGIVLGASQLAPEHWGSYVDAILAGRDDEAIRTFKEHLLPIVTHIYSGRFPSMASHNAKIKEALVQTGVFSSSRVRSPELDVDERDVAIIREGLQRAGLMEVVRQ